jgi:hypothetical protein
MSYKYRVAYLTQRIQINDPMYGQILDKAVSFPSFSTAVQFARSVKTLDSSMERIVGKPVVEQVM